MPVAVITPPAAAVTLAEAKKFLRVDGEDENDLISLHIAAAQGQIDGPDGWLGRAIGLQTLELTGADGAGGWFDLPYWPIVDIVSVMAGSGSVLDPSGYVLGPGWTLRPSFGLRWPWSVRDQRRVRVRYRAGYVDGAGQAAVPAPIKAALLLMISELYDNRDGQVDAARVITPTIDRLLSPFRVHHL